MEEPLPYNNYTPPWYEDAHNWVMIGVGIFVVLLVILGAVFGVRWRANQRLTALERAGQQQATTERVNGELALCENASDPEACRQNLVSGTIVASGTLEACLVLPAGEQFPCVRDIAIQKQDPDVCRSLEGSERMVCESYVFLTQAKEAKDYARCGRVEEENLRASCESELLRYVVEQGSCRSYGVAEAVCMDAAFLAQALEMGDVALCDRLSSAGQTETCRKDVLARDADGDGLSLKNEQILGTRPDVVDTDGDGLSDGEERQRNTNPTNPDTDGDGYGDGEEVKGGYNPNGPGRL